MKEFQQQRQQLRPRIETKKKESLSLTLLVAAVHCALQVRGMMRT
jgi:hypothetical protein